MTTKKIEIQDSEGNVYYPHTDANVVKYEDSTVDKALTQFSNPNLIINSGLLINQRNQTEYTGDRIYTVDRWQLCYSDKISKGKLIVYNDCVALTENNSKGIYFHYTIDDKDFKNIIRNDVTFSVDLKVSNLKTGNMFIQIYCTDSDDNLHRGIKLIKKEELSVEWKRFFVTLKLPNNIKSCYLDIGSIDNLNIYGSIVNSDCSMFIKNAKLEIGKIATPFVPRSYGEELALCQRYYISFNDFNDWIVGHCTKGNYFRFMIPLLIPMRTNPSVIKNINGNTQVYTDYAWEEIPDVNFKFSHSFIVGNNGTTKLPITEGSNYLVKYIPSFDAEIY